MTAPKAPGAHLCLRVGSRHQVAFVPFPAKAPMFVIGAGGALVSFTLPEQIEAGHVDFARQLAGQAWAYADTDPQRAHAARLAEALRYQPCSPRCANWLRYGIQPKNAWPGPRPVQGQGT